MTVAELIERLSEVIGTQLVIADTLRQHPANLGAIAMQLNHAESLTLKLREDLSMQGLHYVEPPTQPARPE